MLPLETAEPGDGGGHGQACSHPVLRRTQGCAEGPQDPMGAPRGQEERPGFGLVASCPQVSGEILCIPAPLLGASQEVLDETWVEGSGDALHQELGVQEQGEKLSVAV